MCGIVGIIKEEGTPITQEEHIDFLAMLQQAQARGRQATGVIYVYDSGFTYCMKSPSASSLAVDYIPHRDGVRALLGHTRASTGGMPSDNINNHPHETSNWALIHNGTCWTTVKDSDLGLKSKCDTEEFVRMFEYQAKQNKEDTISQVLKRSLNEMNGSWSLAFVNKQSNDIYLTTNGSSPLSCVYYPGGMYFASIPVYFDEITRYEDTNGVALGKVLKKSLGAEDYDYVFEPEAYYVYRVSAEAKLKVVSSYEEHKRSRTYGTRTFNGWEDDYGYGSHRHDSWRPNHNKTSARNSYHSKDVKLFTTKQLVEAADETYMTASLLTTEEALFEYYDQQLTTLQVDFMLREEQIADNLVLDCHILEKIAIWNIVKDPAQVGINNGQAYNLRKYYIAGTWAEPPEYILKDIREHFNDVFMSYLHEFIDARAFVDIPDYVWNLLEAQNSVSESVLQETPWEMQVLSVYYGIYFNDTGMTKELVYSDEEDLSDVKKGILGDVDTLRKELIDFKKEEEEPEEFPLSDLACTKCVVKRIMKPCGPKGSGNRATQHICPKCGTVIIQPESFTKKVN